APTPRKPLRLWPGIVLAILLLLLKLVLPVVAPDRLEIGVFGGLLASVAILLWWLLASRAPWRERLGAVALMVVAVAVTWRLVHESISGGAMGFLFPVLALPTLGVAFIAALVAGRRLADGPRRLAMAAGILVGCGMWLLIRTGGFSGNFDHDFHWRWTPTPEERLLAQEGEWPAAVAAAPSQPAAAAAPVTVAPQPGPAADGASAASAAPAPSAATEAVAGPAAQVAGTEGTHPAPAAQTAGTEGVHPAPAAEVMAEVETPGEWPGFRGPRRDGAVRGVRIATDWSVSPPVELWRRPVGPGWSSFAVHGGRFYTQEQRGDDEIVACYDLATGEPLWKHRDAARFWESNAGAGPRGTPTLHDGRVYSLGATGILNALNAADGAVVWSRNAAADTRTEIPGWGFASSPVVFGDLVVVATAGRLAAYELATGKPRWFGPDGGDGYSSPHRATVGGVTQILLESAVGTISVAPADGAVLWKHDWPVGTRIVQPALTADGDVLTTSGGGMRRVAVARGAGGWKVEDRWSSDGLKPYFNDFVVHRGHAYGFDGRILSAVDLADGKRKWKGGRYGNGQLILLPDQDLLLVLSEQGELALVKATPDQFTELAKFPAIQGKTWNHPVLAGDVLLVRNGEEMAAFRLAAPAQASAAR
ncbi:MAG TPA: PQQ-binding-like beta-propeller repeat protein, partial [Thermoanaerobaculia bacterium]|nr:PQQ-binding-like beta-propeller repeat protein [Thermoanaerobaculia bacterium]